jgi:hypothetical protein
VCFLLCFFAVSKDCSVGVCKWGWVHAGMSYCAHGVVFV